MSDQSSNYQVAPSSNSESIRTAASAAGLAVVVAQAACALDIICLGGTGTAIATIAAGVWGWFEGQRIK